MNTTTTTPEKECTYVKVAASAVIDVVEYEAGKDKINLHISVGTKKFILTISEFNHFVIFELFIQHSKEKHESIRLPLEETILENETTSDGKEYFVPTDIESIIQNLFNDYIINAKQLNTEHTYHPLTRKKCLLDHQQSMINTPSVMSFFEQNENSMWRMDVKPDRFMLKHMLRVYNQMSCKIFSITSKLFDRIICLSIQMDEQKANSRIKKVK